ncbi:MAG TPA: hypothetical protein VGN86_08015 [Pyrinomonadaceae bacterium]|jgi:phage-related minor tail protein|nr:hypothetical protein [Pyrinomonadaceae bacterium]
MTRSILRMVLTTLALVLMFAGSFNLNRTRANAIAGDDGGVVVVDPAPVSDCMFYAGCNGGPTFCGRITYPNGGVVECGMH